MNQRNYNLGPVEERETVINHVNGDGSYSIYTCEGPMITKLDKCVDGGTAVIEKEHTNTAGEVTGIIYKIDLNCISFRTKKPAANIVNEEQKQAAAERLRKWRENNSR